jgi:hypothetical protein
MTLIFQYGPLPGGGRANCSVEGRPPAGWVILVPDSGTEVTHPPAGTLRCLSFGPAGKQRPESIEK